jgi:hypothetical protein
MADSLVASVSPSEATLSFTVNGQALAVDASALDVGLNTVTVTVTNGDQTASCSAIVTVVSRQAPSMECICHKQPLRWMQVALLNVMIGWGP